MTVTAAAAGTWQLGDLTVNRLGFGAMRLTPDHLTENVAAGALRLSPGEMDRLQPLRHQGA